MKSSEQRTKPRYDQQLHVIVDRKGREHSLSPHCAALFSMLLKNADLLVTREEIKRVVWGHEHVSDDTINHTMLRLRAKIKKAGGTAQWFIETLPTLGYRLSTDRPASPPDLWTRCKSWANRLFSKHN